MHFIIGVAVFSMLAIAAIVQWKDRILNPLFLFTIFSLFFSMFTIPLLNIKEDADYTHALTLLIYSTTVFIYCVFILNKKKAAFITASWAARRAVGIDKSTLYGCVVMLLVSVILVVYYYQYLVGYNLMVQSIRFGVEDFTTRRLAAYAGERYTGAGVINQFKNTILPLTFFFLGFYLTSKKQRFKLFALLIFGVPFYLWAIVGTGQRTFLFFNLVVLYTYFYNRQKVSTTAFAVFTFVFVWIFGMMSVWLGRSGEGFLEVSDQLLHRIFYSNQISSVEGFRYVFSLPIQYGLEWAEVIGGFIPGMSGSDLSNRVHAYIFSSYRGTSPVSFWVSTYHNFGIFGIPPVVCLVLYLVEKSRSLLSIFPKNDFSILFLSFLFFYIGIVPATNPFQILNNGVIGLIFVLIVLRIARLFGSRRRPVAT